MQKQRLHSTRDPIALASLKQAIGFFAAQAKVLAAAIAALVEHDPVWAALDSSFRSIKGVAGRTVAVLLAELPEIGTLSNKAVAKLAGLAPVARQSGQWKGKSFICGGRANVRQALYMPALVAARFNPDLKAKYQQLIAQGKPAKVAITAIMRKLIVTANALLKADRLWVKSMA